MSTLHSFLQTHRVVKGDANYSDWNLTGIATGVDKGTYLVPDAEYDTFLSLVNDHIFGSRPLTSSLLERHRDVGPLLVDLDFRYDAGGTLRRRFRADHIKNFVAEYVAAMIYFSKVETLPADLDFYVTTKPMPEMDKDKHKDGIHIQCPTLTTSPKYQYAIRGFLLQRDTIRKVFGPTGVNNPAEDVFDVSVIHRNNWFLYGACKPNKAQYSVNSVYRVKVADVEEALEGADPSDFDDLVEWVSDAITVESAPSDSLALLKRLSIRRGHMDAMPLPIRTLRSAEWEELMIAWGSGKGKMDTALPPPKNLLEFAGVGGEEENNDTLIVADNGDPVRGATAAEEDIKLGFRLVRDCLNPERRCGEYHDWINTAICLKNLVNNEESFKVWCEITRLVDPSHKKARMTDAELRAKWALIRVDGSKKLGMGSLQYWAEEDNPAKLRSIRSETNTDWIKNYAANTHVSIANFVYRLYRHEFRCCKGATRGQFEWYHFPVGGHNWRHLRTHTELRARLSGYVKDEYIEAWRKEGKRINDIGADGDQLKAIEGKRKMLRDIERNLEMASFKESVMRECQEKFEDSEFIKKLNTDPYTLGVANGVLELQHWDSDDRSGRPRVHFRAGRPEDFISFQMGDDDGEMGAIKYEPYNPAAPEQKAIAEFFTKIYPDPVLREYVLTLLSSCLEGLNREQRFYVMQGVGSNGKSMIERLMELTFGDYGTSLSTTVFTRKRPDSGAANPDIITVMNRRYIHTGEPDDNEKINTSIMKAWSGGDFVCARGLFADQEKFPIRGKIFMSCNDLPPVSKMDNGTWRRLRVIPHVSVFKDPGDAAIDPSKNIYEKDLHLEGKLKHWRSAFFSLLVHYYDTHYLAHGLKEPDCVTAASNKYKEENDIFNTFFSENFVKDPSAGPLLAKEVRGIFRDWKRSLGRACDLKENTIFDRMKEVCGCGSTDKEFWGVRTADETSDLSGNTIRHSN